MSDKRIENVFNEALTGDVLKNALDFVGFLYSNKMSLVGQHEVHYKGKCACYINTSVEEQSWTVWTEGDYSSEHETFPIDECVKEIAWANVMKCGNCDGVDCSPGKTKTIFGKEFANICNADNVNMVFMFTNPDVKTLECVKKLVLMRKSHLICSSGGSFSL